VFVALHELKHVPVASAIFVAFVSYLALTAAFAEAFYWTIEKSASWFAGSIFEWSRN
jgi:hypothetical protein